MDQKQNDKIETFFLAYQNQFGLECGTLGSWSPRGSVMLCLSKIFLVILSQVVLLFVVSAEIVSLVKSWLLFFSP